MANMQGNPEYKDNMEELTREPATPDIFNKRHQILLNNDAYLKKNKLDKTGDASGVTVTFDETENRENISSGEKVSIIFGKIRKFFSDLKAVAFSGSYKDLKDKPTASDVGAVATVASQGLSDTEKANARENIGAFSSAEGTELKKSVSDGKSAIASAITSAGVSTSSDAAFNTMSNNIKNIIAGNATAGNVLTGNTFSSKSAGRNIDGTMPNNTNVKKILTGSNNSATNGGLSISGTTMRVVPPTGYCDYSGTSWENGLQITIGNAGTGDVVSGKTFTSSAGLNKSGTIIDCRKTDAVFMGCGFNLGVSTPDFSTRNISHVSYQQFNLRATVSTSTSSFPAPTEYVVWNCPHISIPNINYVHVYKSTWTIDTTNYSKMIVSLYGKTNNTGGSLEFRGYVSLIDPTAPSSAGNEGATNALAFAAYRFPNTSNNWLSPIEMSLSSVNQVVHFQISTVHAGDVYVQSVIFVPNAK